MRYSVGAVCIIRRNTRLRVEERTERRTKECPGVGSTGM